MTIRPTRGSHLDLGDEQNQNNAADLERSHHARHDDTRRFSQFANAASKEKVEVTCTFSHSIITTHYEFLISTLMAAMPYVGLIRLRAFGKESAARAPGDCIKTVALRPL